MKVKKEQIFGLSNETAKDRIKFENMPKIDYEFFSNLFSDKETISFNEINIKWLYLHKEHLDQYLYDKDKVIDIKFNDYNINLANLFYIDLLIMHNIDIVNFSYTYEDIKKINKIHTNYENKIPNVLLAKIIIDLLNNYKGICGKDYNDKCKLEIKNKKIIENNLKSFDNLKLNWNQKYILEKSIDFIYTEIILGLIKIKMNESTGTKYVENVENILLELEIDSIDIDEKILSLLSDNSLNKYLITDKDLKVSVTKIYFYYFLLKYIIKDPKYIYNLNLLLKTRQLFVSKIKSKKFNIQSESQDKGMKEKFNFIIKEILNSEYYYDKYLQIQNKSFCKKNKITTGTGTGNEKEVKEKKIKKNENIQIVKYESKSIESNDKSTKEEIISYDNKQYEGDYLEEVDDNTYIIYGNKCPPYINFEDLKKKEIIKEIEVNYSKTIKRGKLYLLCDYNGEYEMLLIKFSENRFYKCKKIENKDKIHFTFITEIGNNNYLISGPKGCHIASFVIDEESISYNKNYLTITDESYKKGIKINENIIALTSNSIYRGENKLIFYDISKCKIVKSIKGYSFVQITNGLEVIPKENAKILICACNHTSIYEEGKNGILLINLDILKNESSEIKNEKQYLNFLNTKSFCVNCVSHISSECTQGISFNNKNESQITEYILAGGIDNDKGKGLINLYKIHYYDNQSKPGIEPLHEIAIKSESIPDFNSVNNIIQLKSGKIAISSSGCNSSSPGIIYLFKKPNLDNYYQGNEIGSESGSYFNGSSKNLSYKF